MPEDPICTRLIFPSCCSGCAQQGKDSFRPGARPPFERCSASGITSPPDGANHRASISFLRLCKMTSRSSTGLWMSITPSACSGAIPQASSIWTCRVPLFSCGEAAPAESYIFNPSGQSINLEDLLCICRSEAGNWIPCGNPVKDAMVTKIKEPTRDVAAVIYAPVLEALADLDAAAARFAELLRSECGASESGWRIE